MQTEKQFDEAPESRARKPVKQRWYYEPVSQPIQHDSQPPALALVLGLPSVSVDTLASVSSGPESTGGASVLVNDSLVPGASASLFLGEDQRPDPSSLEVGTPRNDWFTIVVSFPGGELSTHVHTVYYGMPVSRLKQELADLLEAFGPVVLEVGPMWDVLDHAGTITDRTFPHTHLPCPYLEQGSEVRVSLHAFSSEDRRRAVVARGLLKMNRSSVDGELSPHDLVYGGAAQVTFQLVEGELPTSGAGLASGAEASSSSAVTSEDAVEEWGSISSRSIGWGRPNPPIHPDEGIEWSNISDRAARVDWDSRASSGSPPPKTLAPDLFSDRGDGFPLSHLRRTGENAETKAIVPVYVSSGLRRGTNLKVKKGSVGNIAEVVFTDPFETGDYPSPTKGKKDRSTPNEDWDMILEDQRLADLRLPKVEQLSDWPPKRKLESLKLRHGFVCYIPTPGHAKV